MINKKEIRSRIEMAKTLAEKYELPGIKEDLELLDKSNEDYKVSVLFIGGYSAGKSALLNCIIGDEKLVENQSPETAIATELNYATVDSVYAIADDGSMQAVNSTADVQAEEYSHIIYNIDSENLMQLPEYVLVDTPGFDSGIEKHNKALMQYIGKKGTAYVLVVDCEKGTLSHSALNYLNEVSNYSNDIAVVINKCDKKTEEDVQQIKEHISKLLVSNCGRECPIITTSKYDDEVVTKVMSLISDFKPQELYEKNIGSLVDRKVDELAKALKVIEKNKSLDVSDLELEIEKRELAKEKIQEEIQKQQKAMQNKLHNEVKNKIINNISVKLQNNARVLADAYKISVENFQEKVVSMIRPIIIKSVENYETVAYEDIIKSINVSKLDLGINGEEVGAILNDVLGKMENVSAILGSIKKDDSGKGNSNEKGKYTAAMSLLAIATDVVMPPLELLIVFLPNIINLVKTFLEGNQDQKLVEEIQRKVIPQIVQKMSEELENSLNTVEDVMAENVQNTISELIQVETDALEKAIQKKNEMENAYEKYVSELQADIMAIGY